MNNEMNIVQKNAEAKSHQARSFGWYQNIYGRLDPREIAARCGLPYDGHSFSLRIMNRKYLAAFPEFSLEPADTGTAGAAKGYEKILFIRFLCEGKYAESSGKQLSYREIPWGDLYYPNFEGRCIKRLARKFGGSIETFRKTAEENLSAEKLEQSDAGYRFEFCSGFYMSFLLWKADEEFPASAQILFDDNFPHGFTAEDCAVAGEVAMNHMLSAIENNKQSV